MENLVQENEILLLKNSSPNKVKKIVKRLKIVVSLTTRLMKRNKLKLVMIVV